MFATLESNSKQYPLKAGQLVGCRAAKLRFNRAVEWRCVIEILEDARVVRIIALGPHVETYKSGERRRKTDRARKTPSWLTNIITRNGDPGEDHGSDSGQAIYQVARRPDPW
ncbi:MAG: hypothetical protein M3N13_02495 [Candidatus Eremiobacteraeota bacterium]|nr:hypothetical protein [Candidatus Eremiobacteraeota bacterium]